MEPRRWFFTTLALIIIVAGIAVAGNVTVDIYGIFRDAHGRSLPALAISGCQVPAQ